MADVFISYARADWDHAKQLADALSARGYQVWWDVELVGSDNFRDVIMSELEAAKAVIVIWSASSCCSNFVLDEAGRALRAGKLVATRLDNFDPQNLPLGFGTQHTELVTQLDRISPALIKLGIDTAAKKSATEQARLLSETAFWDEISASEDIQDFNLYLNEYPDGLHRAHAKLRLRKLGADKSGLLQSTASLITAIGAKPTPKKKKTATQASTDQSSPPVTSHGFLALAIMFAILAPIVVDLMRAWFISGELSFFRSSEFDELRNSGLVFGTFLIFVTALLITRSRKAALGDTERALYWAGCALAAVYSLGGLFNNSDLPFIVFKTEFTGWLVGTFLMTVSAMLIIMSRSSALGKTETAIYCLVPTFTIGFLLGLGFVLAGLIDTTNDFYLFIFCLIVGVGLTIIVSLYLRQPPLRK